MVLDLQGYKDFWLQRYIDLKKFGKLYSPRGQKTLEIENYQFEGSPLWKLPSFKERKLSVKYIAGEFKWYLSADRNNTSIEDYAILWKTIKNQKKPYWNSNYGYYIFKEGQFEYCVNQLKYDKDSRQAVIVINRPDVMMSDTKDKICTSIITFRIRDNRLNMSVHMRSNDFIFGTQIDYFQFATIQEMLYIMLKETYPDLQLGNYCHKADSFHIYERHFSLLDKIVENNGENFEYIRVPLIKGVDEVRSLIRNQYNIKYEFSRWIIVENMFKS